ncbi:hypothetical protein D3C81_1111990 [compost metagenome]
MLAIQLILQHVDKFGAVILPDSWLRIVADIISPAFDHRKLIVEHPGIEIPRGYLVVFAVPAQVDQSA